jgi:hypothetical protein
LVGFHHKGTYAIPPHVLSEDFRRAAKSGLARLEQDGRPTTASPLTTSLKREILATGVARSLGFGVRQAKDVAAKHSDFMDDAKGVIRDETHTSKLDRSVGSERNLGQAQSIQNGKPDSSNREVAYF